MTDNTDSAESMGASLGRRIDDLENRIYALEQQFQDARDTKVEAVGDDEFPDATMVQDPDSLLASALGWLYDVTATPGNSKTAQDISEALDTSALSVSSAMTSMFRRGLASRQELERSDRRGRNPYGYWLTEAGAANVERLREDSAAPVPDNDGPPNRITIGGMTVEARTNLHEALTALVRWADEEAGAPGEGISVRDLAERVGREYEKFSPTMTNLYQRRLVKRRKVQPESGNAFYVYRPNERGREVIKALGPWPDDTDFVYPAAEDDGPLTNLNDLFDDLIEAEEGDA